MQRALQIAQFGFGNVAPNPMVGCVIVYNNEIIGEGYHEQYGKAHAEVNAVKNAQQKYKNPEILNQILHESTFFVTLEPCSHFGKTPPCAELLVNIKPKKVVICNTDSNPLVAGKGILRLKEANIEVETGILAEEGRKLNKRFFTFMEKKRPYIVLKWAESKDGFIAPDNHLRTQLSGKLSQYITHKWRTEEQSIMIGTNTALVDNPKLTARLWQGNQPVRIVIDKYLKIPADFHIFDTNFNNSTKTFIFNFLKNEQQENLFFVKLENQNETNDKKYTILDEILTYLYEQKIQSILVEGGSYLLNDFIQNNLFDEVRIWKTNKILGNGIKAPILPFIPTKIEAFEEDFLVFEDFL